MASPACVLALLIFALLLTGHLTAHDGYQGTETYRDTVLSQLCPTPTQGRSRTPNRFIPCRIHAACSVLSGWLVEPSFGIDKGSIRFEQKKPSEAFDRSIGDTNGADAPPVSSSGTRLELFGKVSHCNLLHALRHSTTINSMQLRRDECNFIFIAGARMRISGTLSLRIELTARRLTPM